MKHFSLSVILDSIFVSFILFLLFFMFFKVFTTTILSYTFSIILSFTIALVLGKILHERKKISNLKTALDKKAKSLSLQLNLLPHEQVLEIFSKAYKGQNKTVKIKKGFIFLEEDNTLVFPKFSFDGVTKTDLVKAYNQVPPEHKIIIISSDFSADFCDFSAKFSCVTLENGNKAYELLESTDNLPEFKYNPFPTKTKPKIIKNVLQKKRAKNFLAFGIFFLLSSYFVPFKFYYILSGIIMLIISLLSIILGKEKA